MRMNSLVARNSTAACTFAVAVLSLKCAAVRAEEPVCEQALIYRHGEVHGTICTRDADKHGLTIVNLSAAWTPAALANPRDGDDALQQVYASTYVALADERPNQLPRDQVFERYLELFGIMPSLRVVKQRLLDTSVIDCERKIDDEPLRAIDHTLTAFQLDVVSQRKRVARVAAHAAKVARATAEESMPVPRYLEKTIKVVSAIKAMQGHLFCHGLLPQYEPGVFDTATQSALRQWQQMNMVISFGALDETTRERLIAGARELVFRAALRALRERVVAASGLIEDGSANNDYGTVLGRVLDPEEMRSLNNGPPLAAAANDLVSLATETAALALGWRDTDGLDRFLREYDFESDDVLKVALALPQTPAYHSSHMELRAEIDRGDVYYDYPFLPDGRARRQPIQQRPTLVLYARHDEQWIPLVRWNTTIGGFQPEQVPGRGVGLRYKESPVGPRLWRDLIVSPTWLPPPTTPDDDLIKHISNGNVVARQELVGPGYRSAYGLAMLVHLKQVPLPRNRRKEREIEANSTAATFSSLGLFDEGVRTHGSVSYASILRGQSHGCHRLFNHLALRLAGFLLTHRNHTRHGNLPVAYDRTILHGGQRLSLRARTRGYRFEFTPPISIDVLEGRVRGRRKTPVKGLRPLREDLIEAYQRSLNANGESASAP